MAKKRQQAKPGKGKLRMRGKPSNTPTRQADTEEAAASSSTSQAAMTSSVQPSSTLATAVDSVRPPVGLHNLGNTCFFNSAVQVLVSAPPLQRYFASEAAHQAQGSLNPAMVELFEVATAATPASASKQDKGQGPGAKGGRGAGGKAVGGSKAYSPQRLHSAVCRIAPQFKGRQEQDSHELLRLLLDGLVTELQPPTSAAPPPEEPVGSSASGLPSQPSGDAVVSSGTARADTPFAAAVFAAAAAGVVSPDVRRQTFIEALFGGQLSSTVTCSACAHQSIGLETFMDLSLPIPAMRQTSSVGRQSASTAEEAQQPQGGWKSAADKKRAAKEMRRQVKADRRKQRQGGAEAAEDAPKQGKAGKKRAASACGAASLDVDPGIGGAAAADVTAAGDAVEHGGDADADGDATSQDSPESPGFVPFPHTLPTISEVPNFTPFPPLVGSIPFTQLRHETSEPNPTAMDLELPLESTTEQDIDAIRAAVGEMAASGLPLPEFPDEDEARAAASTPAEAAAAAPSAIDLERRDSPDPLPPLLPRPPFSALKLPSIRDDVALNLPLDSTADDDIEAIRAALGDVIGNRPYLEPEDPSEPPMDAPPHAVAPSAPLSNSIPFTQLTADSSKRTSEASGASAPEVQGATVGQLLAGVEESDLLQLPVNSTTDEDIDAIRAALMQLSPTAYSQLQQGAGAVSPFQPSPPKPDAMPAIASQQLPPLTGSIPFTQLDAAPSNESELPVHLPLASSTSDDIDRIRFALAQNRAPAAPLPPLADADSAAAPLPFTQLQPPQPTTAPPPTMELPLDLPLHSTTSDDIERIRFALAQNREPAAPLPPLADSPEAPALPFTQLQPPPRSVLQASADVPLQLPLQSSASEDLEAIRMALEEAGVVAPHGPRQPLANGLPFTQLDVPPKTAPAPDKDVLLSLPLQSSASEDLEAIRAALTQAGLVLAPGPRQPLANGLPFCEHEDLAGAKSGDIKVQLPLQGSTSDAISAIRSALQSAGVTPKPPLEDRMPFAQLASAKSRDVSMALPADATADEEIRAIREALVGAGVIQEPPPRDPLSNTIPFSQLAAANSGDIAVNLPLDSTTEEDIGAIRRALKSAGVVAEPPPRQPLEQRMPFTKLARARSDDVHVELDRVATAEDDIEAIRSALMGAGIIPQPPPRQPLANGAPFTALSAAKSSDISLELPLSSTTDDDITAIRGALAGAGVIAQPGEESSSGRQSSGSAISTPLAGHTQPQMLMSDLSGSTSDRVASSIEGLSDLMTSPAAAAAHPTAFARSKSDLSSSTSADSSHHHQHHRNPGRSPSPDGGDSVSGLYASLDSLQRGEESMVVSEEENGDSGGGDAAEEGGEEPGYLPPLVGAGLHRYISDDGRSPDEPQADDDDGEPPSSSAGAAQAGAAAASDSDAGESMSGLTGLFDSVSDDELPADVEGRGASVQACLAAFFSQETVTWECPGERGSTDSAEAPRLARKDGSGSFKRRVSFSDAQPDVKFIVGSEEQRGTDLLKAVEGMDSFSRPLSYEGGSFLVTARIDAYHPDRLKLKLIPQSSEDPATSMLLTDPLEVASVFYKEVKDTADVAEQQRVKVQAQLLMDCIADLIDSEGIEGMMAMAASMELMCVAKERCDALTCWRVKGQACDDLGGGTWEYPMRSSDPLETSSRAFIVHPGSPDPDRSPRSPDTLRTPPVPPSESPSPAISTDAAATAGAASAAAGTATAAPGGQGAFGQDTAAPQQAEPVTEAAAAAPIASGSAEGREVGEASGEQAELMAPLQRQSSLLAAQKNDPAYFHPWRQSSLDTTSRERLLAASTDLFANADSPQQPAPASVPRTASPAADEPTATPAPPPPTSNTTSQLDGRPAASAASGAVPAEPASTTSAARCSGHPRSVGTAASAAVSAVDAEEATQTAATTGSASLAPFDTRLQQQQQQEQEPLLGPAMIEVPSAGPDALAGRGPRGNLSPTSSGNISSRKSSLKNVQRQATKGYRVYRAPLLLTIHLKRFEQDSLQGLRKIDGRLGFSFDLDLSPYCDVNGPDAAGAKYRLVGIVEHTGKALRTGHYDAYVQRGLPQPQGPFWNCLWAAFGIAPLPRAAQPALKEPSAQEPAASTVSAEALAPAAAEAESHGGHVEGTADAGLKGTAGDAVPQDWEEAVADPPAASLTSEADTAAAEDAATEVSMASADAEGSAVEVMSASTVQAAQAPPAAAVAVPNETSAEGGSEGASEVLGAAATSSVPTPEQLSWYKASDSKVKRVSIEEVTACQAYLLLYMRYA